MFGMFVISGKFLVSWIVVHASMNLNATDQSLPGGSYDMAPRVNRVKEVG